MTTDIIDRLNTYCERGRASDREIARLTGQSIAEFDADVTAPDRHVDGKMTFPEFCTICLHIDRPLHDQFMEYIEAKCDRIEARGSTVEYPLRLGRWAWYAEWNAFNAQDARDTDTDARYAGCP